jgi:hypothetical protein
MTGAAGCAGVGLFEFEFAVTLALLLGGGGVGARKYDHPKSTTIERMAAIRNLD